MLEVDFGTHVQDWKRTIDETPIDQTAHHEHIQRGFGLEWLGSVQRIFLLWSFRGPKDLAATASKKC